MEDVDESLVFRSTAFVLEPVKKEMSQKQNQSRKTITATPSHQSKRESPAHTAQVAAGVAVETTQRSACVQSLLRQQRAEESAIDCRCWVGLLRRKQKTRSLPQHWEILKKKRNSPQHRQRRCQAESDRLHAVRSASAVR